ncbi:MAG: TOBE domain-containing protein [Sulfurimonas sp.]
MQNSIQGRIWISRSEHNFLGHGRIELLINVGKFGSITKAAKAMKMSYKAAWDAIDTMSNLSEYPLVTTLKGGKGGGGTHLTSYAKDLIASYEILQEEHQQFLNNLSKRINEKNGHFNLLHSLNVRISARNQLRAKVIKIQKGAIESEIFLELSSKEVVMAIITNDSLNALEIEVGSDVYALFKANALTISRDLTLQKSDMNRFTGKVIRINRDNFNCEVVIQLKSSNTLCSTMPVEIFDDLGLQIDTEVVSFCKPKSIIIGLW